MGVYFAGTGNESVHKDPSVARSRVHPDSGCTHVSGFVSCRVLCFLSLAFLGPRSHCCLTVLCRRARRSSPHDFPIAPSNFVQWQEYPRSGLKPIGPESRSPNPEHLPDCVVSSPAGVCVEHHHMRRKKRLIVWPAGRITLT